MSDTLKAVIITVHRSGGSIHVPSFHTLVLRVPAVDGAASGKDLGNCNPEAPKNSFQSFCNTLNVRDDVPRSFIYLFIYLFINFAKDKLAGEISQN